MAENVARDMTGVSKAFENPLPHLRVAKSALTQVVRLQKDLWMLDAELKAITQAKRAVWAALAAISFIVLATLTFFWITLGLHEDGWSSYTLAILSFLIFGALMTIFIGLALSVEPQGSQFKEPQGSQFKEPQGSRSKVPQGSQSPHSNNPRGFE